MSGVWGWFLGIVVAFGAGLLSSLFEPVKRRVERLGRLWFDRAPFDVYVETDLRVIWAGHMDWIGARFHLPGDGPEEAPPGSLGDWQDWVRAAGGYDYGMTTVKVTIVARSAGTLLVGVPIIKARRSDAPHGVSVSRPVGGASVNPLGFDVHLEEGSTWVSLSDNDGYVKGPLSWSLKSGEVESFLLRGLAQLPGLWEWHAEFPVSTEGIRRMHKVTNGGEDFRTVGGPWSDELMWFDGSWRQRPSWSP